MSHGRWIAAALLVLATPAAAQVLVTPTPPDFPRGRISGTLFADAYGNLAGNPRHAYDSAGNDSAQVNIDGRNNIGRDLNGVQVRRVYFQLDNDLSIRYSTRFRLEVDGRSLTSDARVGVAVKAAYMQVRNVYPRADLLFGLVSTPVFEFAEDYWQYRAVEKTAADFRALSPSSDMGIQLKGFVDANHVLGYTVLLGNGTGNKPETNRDKRAYASFPIRWRDLRVEPYLDYENVHRGQDRATCKLFVGHDVPHGAVGFEMARQVAHKSPGAYTEAVVQSLFARYSASPTIATFARADYWQKDRRVAHREDQWLFIMGVDWQPAKDVHFIPNIESLQYVQKGAPSAASLHPYNDLQARVTLYWKFSKPQS